MGSGKELAGTSVFDRAWVAQEASAEGGGSSHALGHTPCVGPLGRDGYGVMFRTSQEDPVTTVERGRGEYMCV